MGTLNRGLRWCWNEVFFSLVFWSAWNNRDRWSRSMTQWSIRMNEKIISLYSHLIHWVRVRFLVVCWYRPVYGLSGSAREKTLIKLNRVGDNLFLSHWVPEQPGLVISRVADEYTLL